MIKMDTPAGEIAMNALGASKWILFVSMAATFANPAVAELPDEIYLNGFEQFTLTIDDFLAWCSIQENGATYNEFTVFNQGTVVDLNAGPVTGFIWGHWTGTDGDSGSGDTNQVTTVTMKSDRTVIACCPFPNGTGC
jgi:hypothetical protein